MRTEEIAKTVSIVAPLTALLGKDLQERDQELLSACIECMKAYKKAEWPDLKLRMEPLIEDSIVVEHKKVGDLGKELLTSLIDFITTIGELRSIAPKSDLNFHGIGIVFSIAVLLTVNGFSKHTVDMYYSKTW